MIVAAAYALWLIASFVATELTWVEVAKVIGLSTLRVIVLITLATIV